jgi:sulfur carrier protein
VSEPRPYFFEYNEGRGKVSNRARPSAMPHSTTQTIEIVVNGDNKTVPAGLSVLELLLGLGVLPDRVAVELNRSIVRRPQWQSVRVDAGAQIEIVQFVGGG